jgi:crotonobetainyl-CoA:carnitine CoA-transferase CaiB-like acyl-CoA transferase
MTAVSLSLNPEAWFVWHAVEVEEALTAREDFLREYCIASHLAAEKSVVAREATAHAAHIQDRIAAHSSTTDPMDLRKQAQMATVMTGLMQSVAESLKNSLTASREAREVHANVEMYREALNGLVEDLFVTEPPLEEI